jgi:predicted nucleic acid-binding protein
MNRVIYFDTSALAKWYLNEPKSDEVEEYIRRCGPVAISEITIVEMRALLARRRREKSIDAHMESQVFGVFREDIRQGFLNCRTLPSGLAESSINLLSMMPDIPLKTLDTLHLVIAREIQAGALATADRVMIQGAGSMGFEVVRFDS